MKTILKRIEGFWKGDGILRELITKRNQFDKELFKKSVLYNVKTLYRKTLEEAGWFPVWNGRCMGLDETFLCNRATSNSKAIVVSERQLVGHLSFGQQNETMREYFLSHKEIFDLKF